MNNKFFLAIVFGFSVLSCQNAGKSEENNEKTSEVQKEAEASVHNSSKNALDYFKMLIPENTNLTELENSEDGTFMVIKIEDSKAGPNNNNTFELWMQQYDEGKIMFGYHEFRTNGSTGDTPIFFNFENGKKTNSSGLTLEDLLTNKEDFMNFSSVNRRKMLNNEDCCDANVFLPKKGKDLEIVTLPSKYSGNLKLRPESYDVVGKVTLGKDGKFTFKLD